MAMISSTNKMQFFSGDGEMATLTRKKDWSKTSLGMPDKWPQSLRTALSIILNSKFPMFLWWGPELICFYNDAYRPSLGIQGKHPSILGTPAKNAWPEIWPIIKPLIDQVLKGGEATWSEDQLIPIFRNGKLEDVFWTFSYSPVYDESGNVTGVLVTCSETTEKILTYRKLEESNNQLHFAIEAAELGTFDYNPLTDKFTANRRLKEWFGLPADEQIELSKAIEVIAEKDRQNVTEAIQKALDYSSGGNYDIEFAIIHPLSQKETIVQAKGKAWFNEEKSAYRFNGTLQDVTAHVISRKKTEESERGLRLMILQAPVAIAILRGTDYKVEIINARALELLGRTEEEVLNKPLLQTMPELQEQEIKQLLDNVYTTGITFSASELPVQIVREKKTETVYINFSYEALYDVNGTINGVMAVGSEVTSHVIIRKEIEESEARFRKVADSAPVLIWMSGTDKLCNYFNTAWLDFTGRPIEEQMGDGWVKAIHPDDIERCLEVYTNAFDRREEFYMECRLKRHDDEYRWVSDKGVPRFTPNGTFEGYIGACMDIHDRVMYRLKLMEDEERLNIVINASGLATWEVDIATNEIKHSGRYAEIFGYTNETLPDRLQLIKQIHPEDLGIRQAAFEEAYKTGMLHYEIRYILEDQSIHWVEAKGKIFFDHNNIPGRILGTLRDTTEEKNRQQDLIESEQKFRLLADSMPQLVWTGDSEGNLNYFNKSVYGYSGLSPEQVMKDGWMQIVHPEDREENVKVWTEAVKTGKDFLFEHRFRRFDGEYRWQLSRAIPQKDIDGIIQMWVGTSTDIQEQKTFAGELEKEVHERTMELEEKNEDLEKMNKELQSFAYISSHDLQEPLRKIQTFSTRIVEKEYDNLSDGGKEYFRKMQDSAKRMQILIEDLLAYSRTSTAERTFEKTDLNDIVEEVKEDLNEEFDQKHATLETGEMCNADVIPFQFRQLIYNLISNSLKFAKPGRPSRIKVRSEHISSKKLQDEKFIPETNYCHISISDNGIGFDSQYSEKIFEVFQRLHGRDQYKGTGIGLAIVKKIVENHHGIITAKGQLDKGATFDIYIPAEQKNN